MTLKHNIIVNYRDRMASEFSNITSNRSLFIIKQIFSFGSKICANTENITKTISYLSENEYRRNKFLMPNEIDNLLEACQKVRFSLRLQALILLGVEHGASKQEALSLSWDDIDFNYEGKGLIRFFRTKNGMERTEYLMPRTRKALLDLGNHQNFMRLFKKYNGTDSKYVFSKLDGTPLNRFDDSWRKVCEIAGIKDLHFHDLRHTYCSNLMLSGADLKDVKEMIGHKDLSMTDRYSHLTNMRKLSRQNALAEHYSNPNGEQKN